MRLMIDATCREIRCGFEVRSESLHLSGHGIDKESAAISLQEAVAAWCSGLKRAGCLNEAMVARGLQYEDLGAGIEVRIDVQSSLTQSQRKSEKCVMES